jgi:predicted nucleic-acid-binding protein
MLLIDANAILRYTLNDNTEMAEKVRLTIVNNKVLVRYEIIAEVVYVLIKVYSLPRKEITEGIKTFLATHNVEVESKEVMSIALDTFADVNMDFVDCVLYGFRAILGFDVLSFDKRLNSMIEKLTKT